MQNRWLVPFLNLGHLLDHLAMLVFPTAVVALGREWGRAVFRRCCRWRSAASSRSAPSPFRRAGSPTTGAATR